MTKAKLLYFTAAEYLLMMQLAGNRRYSVLYRGKEPEEDALVEALTSLFRRGLLKRRNDRLVPDGEGKPFARMRQAPFAVAVKAAPGIDAMLYPDGPTLWITELTNTPGPQWYRLRRIAVRDVARWAFEQEILPPPALTESDAAEVQKLFKEELREPSGETLAAFKRYLNGGRLLCEYELLAGRDGHMILCGSGQESFCGRIYTAEALSEMLAACFGKDSYDHCECAGSRHGENL